MITTISGNVTSIFPDDINTDDIIPAWTLQESTDRTFFGQYAFQYYDAKFVPRCTKHETNIIIAGENFGCGSSREQAIYALQHNNVVAVIAQSFPDIFYRNALNNGLVLIQTDNVAFFELDDEVVINLQEKKIVVGDKEAFSFDIPDVDQKTYMSGGKKGRVRTHLSCLLTKEEEKKTTTKKHTPPPRPQTMVEKIVSDHIGKPTYAEEKVEELPIDVLFFNEVIGPPAIEDFSQAYSDVFAKHQKKPTVFDPTRVFLIPDHTVPSSSIAVSEGIDLMERFAKEQGMKCYKEGDGIEHVVLIEDGYVVPGSIILGTDSHTDTNGALNTLAFGVGTTDGSYAMATGHLYDFEIPHTIRVNLHGQFPHGVYPKDLILFLIGKLGVDGAVKRVVEFGGPALKTISMDGRTTIANMAVEMGARTAIFEHDDILEDYVKDRAQYPYKPYLPDTDCTYEQTLDIDLVSLEPCIAFPHKPGNVTPISQIDKYMAQSQQSNSVDFPPVHDLIITDAFLGACTNGRYEDLVAAAKVLEGHSVHPDTTFIVIPASRKVYNRLLKEGYLSIFAEAGANIESSNCGPCFGKHMGIVGKGAQMISSSNRNYIGRMGSKDAKIFLASPVTVAAAAVAGKIVDPREYL